jgi:hypothetical protein
MFRLPCTEMPEGFVRLIHQSLRACLALYSLSDASTIGEESARVAPQASRNLVGNHPEDRQETRDVFCY